MAMRFGGVSTGDAGGFSLRGCTCGSMMVLLVTRCFRGRIGRLRGGRLLTFRGLFSLGTSSRLLFRCCGSGSFVRLGRGSSRDGLLRGGFGCLSGLLFRFRLRLGLSRVMIMTSFAMTTASLVAAKVQLIDIHFS